MKKVIISVCLVGVAAVAGYAQTSHLYNYEGKQGAQLTKGVVSKKVDASLERAVIRARRAAAQDQKTRTNVVGFGTVGLINEEGKAASQSNKKSASACKPKAKKPSNNKQTNPGVWNYIKASFGYGPYPGETEEQYRARVTGAGAITNQPFK